MSLKVFTEKKLRHFVADFILLNLNFIHKNDKLVRGNVHTSSIARWKARGRLSSINKLFL